MGSIHSQALKTELNWWRVGTFVVIVAALISLAAGDGDASGAHGHSNGQDSGLRTQDSGLVWAPCLPDWECATLQVPLDYGDPAGATIDLALARLPAADPSARIGSLLMNFGGPGGPAIAPGRSWARGLNPEIRRRFDIVAMDPRGVGRSSPIDCVQNIQQFYGADGTPDSEEEWQTLIGLAKEFAANCAENGEILKHMGTRDVVRDIDRVRVALGEDRITYFGYSYGTTIGQVYADTYPSHVRAVVLDGAYRFWDADSLFEQTVAFEKALDAFLTDCRNRPSCPLAKRGDPSDVLNQLLKDVEAGPIPAPGSDRPLHPGEAITGIDEALYSEGSWPELARALAQASNGDGTGLNRLADAYLSREGNGSYSDSLAVYAAVSCIDGAQVSEEGLRAEAVRHNAAAARMGSDNLLKSALPCAYWPAPAQPLTGPVHANGAPPILVVATTGDPATPYDQGVEVAHALASGVLLTHVGEGHTIYGGGNRCIDTAVNAYLLELVAPESGSSCETGAGSPTAPPPTESPAASTATVTPDAGATAAEPVESHQAAERAQADGSGVRYPIIAAVVAMAALVPAAIAFRWWRGRR